MKKILFLSLILVVLVSGCINFGGGSLATFGVSETIDNPDMYLKVETSNDDVKAGRTMQVKTIIENKGDTTLNDVTITAYDLCLFRGDDKEASTDELKANRSKEWIWKWVAADTQFETECDIKFLTEYNTTTHNERSVVVLEESEYYARELKQNLDDIPRTSYSSDNSLDISIGFSEEQPFLEGEEVYVYINYNDVGNGILKQIEKGDITIKMSDNLQGECSGYSSTCTGTENSCESIANSDGCAAQEGCDWVESECAWTEFDCSWTQTTCSWTGDMCEGNDVCEDLERSDCIKTKYDSCTGDAGCDVYIDRNECEIAGICEGIECTGTTKDTCEVDEICSGVAESCDQVDECSSQAGCSEYHVLASPLKFVSKKAPATSCKLTTSADQLLDLGEIEVSARYKYQFYNSLLIGVKP